MDIKRLTLLAVIASLASCSTIERPVEHQEGSSLLQKYGLAVCLGAAFESPELRSDVNKAAVGYMERGDFPLEAYEEVREIANEWLQKDYPSKRGGQVNTAKCIDFYLSEDLGGVLDQYAD